MSQNCIDNRIAASDFSVQKMTAGQDAVMKVQQTDDSNKESNAVFEASTGGENGGDPAVRFRIEGENVVTMGLNNQVPGNPFTIVRGEDFRTGDQQFYISGEGQVEARHMPRFLYSLAHDLSPPKLTGDGTIVPPILFDNLYFDRPIPDYNQATGIFTSPFDGTYFFDLQMCLEGINPSVNTSIHFGIEVRHASGEVKVRFLSCVGCENAVTTTPFGGTGNQGTGVYTVNKYQFARLQKGEMVVPCLQGKGTSKTISLYDRRALQPATGIYSYFSGGLFI